MRDVIKTGMDLTAQQMPQSIRKGPIEGLLLVDGYPQMERMDMPVICFESILALQRFNEDQRGEQGSKKRK